MRDWSDDLRLRIKAFDAGIALGGLHAGDSRPLARALGAGDAVPGASFQLCQVIRETVRGHLFMATVGGIRTLRLRVGVFKQRLFRNVADIGLVDIAEVGNAHLPWLGGRGVWKHGNLQTQRGISIMGHFLL